MTNTFPTERGSWLVALIWAGAVLAIVGGFAQLQAGAPAVVRGLVLVFLIGAAGFMLWVLYATAYVLGEAELLVRSGPLRYRVSFSAIQSVTPSRDPRSSPAGSLDRLLIRWSPDDRRLLISPARRLEFLQELSQRCPHLSFRGDQLVAGDAA